MAKGCSLVLISNNRKMPAKKCFLDNTIFLGQGVGKGKVIAYFFKNGEVNDGVRIRLREEELKLLPSFPESNKPDILLNYIGNETIIDKITLLCGYIHTDVPKKVDRNILSLMMLYPRITRSIYEVTKLSIPDIIANSIISIEELASKTRTDCSALYRVMRMLAGYDIFHEKKPRYFENSELSIYLTSNHSDSLRDSVIYRIELGSESWNELLYSLQTGKPAFDKIHNMSFFQYIEEHPEKALVFNKAMEAQYRKDFNNILSTYDFSFCRKLIDVGGGRGYFVSEFLKKYPNATAVLFDLESVLREFDNSQNKNILSRLEVCIGDFFTSVPFGGDIYFLKSILHDWNDEQAVKILCNISKIMNKNSRLLIVEIILPEKNSPDFSFLMDLQMLVQHGGRERNLKEYKHLLHCAGCLLCKVHSLPGIFKIIEAKLQGL